jgi:hypothetical protein
VDLNRFGEHRNLDLNVDVVVDGDVDLNVVSTVDAQN